MSPARIYKSDLSNVSLKPNYRCISVLSNAYDNYSFGQLQSFSDETLDVSSSVEYTISENILIVLIPLVGKLNIASAADGSIFKIAPQEIKVMSFEKGDSYSITNESTSCLVNYLQIHIETKDQIINFKKAYVDSYNQMSKILSVNNVCLNYGVFHGRAETTHRIDNPNNGIFAYVLNGAFEVENRLIETRDGLTLWDIENVSMEALSNNAILLMLELPLL